MRTPYDADVDQAGRGDPVVDERPEGHPGDDVGQEDRDIEHRVGEDDRDHTGLIDLEGDVGGRPAVHSSPDHPFGEGDRDPTLALLHEDHEHQQDQGQRQDHAELGLPTLRQDEGAAGGDPGHHVGEDDDRHPVADPTLGDELAEPHDEGRTGRERQDDEAGAVEVEVRDQVDVGRRRAEEPGGAVVEHVDETGRLQERQADSHVPGRLGDLLLPDRPLVTPLLELRDHRRQQLDDDGAGDVRHDPEAEQSHLQQPAAGEEVQEAEDPRRLGLGLELLDLLDGDEGHDEIGAQLVQADDEKGEHDLVAQVRNLEDVLEAREHRPSSSRSRRTRRRCPRCRGYRLVRAFPARVADRGRTEAGATPPGHRRPRWRYGRSPTRRAPPRAGRGAARPARAP